MVKFRHSLALEKFNQELADVKKELAEKIHAFSCSERVLGD